MKTRVVFLGGLAIFLIGFSHPAFSSGIQMLPPLQNDGTNDICASSQGNKVLTWDGLTPLKCNPNVTVDTHGRVGVGTASPQAMLDVSGGVKVSNDVAACSAVKAGTIRWNGSAMQYCNGAAWQAFGGAEPVNSAECGEGTLVQWNNATKTSSCKPIYQAMSCVTKTASIWQEAALSCDPGYYVVAGSCWRTEGSGGGINGGLIVGDRISKTEYRCRIEGAAATNIFVTCCR